ncbi:MAG TPA: hypothetical protein VMW47_04780 [Verrucomicrobiae bacterium]|nr:hypothetical protein [Verrucomicrobiae bacterium]
MTTPGWLALAATCAGLVALLADGRRGAAVAAAALGLGGGGIASLAGGPGAFLVVSVPSGLAAVAIAVGGRPGPGGTGALLVPALAELFGARALRVAGGVIALLAARWLAGHLAAGLVATPAPVFSCAFLWEVALMRAGLARTAVETAVGLLAAAVATSAFLLLGGGTEKLAVAALAVAVAAAGCILVAIPGWGRVR